MATNAPALPEGYLESLEASGFSPGWAKREPQMWPVPRQPFIPMVWRHDDALAQLTRSADFISTEFAERRNLILVNPVPDNIYPTCRNLVAAYQLVLPGETARSHRHTPNALRLVLSVGKGTYTLVNGARVDMAAGDVVLTPQWMWHGHANYSNEPAFWIDFLDVPLVQKLDNMFFEHHPDTLEAVQSHPAEPELRFAGADLMARARQDGDFAFGQDLMPTIGLNALGFAQGERQESGGCIENSIFAVTGGEAVIVAEPLGRVTLTRGDVIVVPAWTAYSIEGGASGATLLRVSDAPVYEKLKFRDVGQER